MNTMLKNAQIFKLGKSPVVVVPVAAWESLREHIDTLEEYREMSLSKNYKKDIALARASRKQVSSAHLYKKLGLV